MLEKSHRHRVYVTRDNFDECVREISKHKEKGFDTETTGLYPYHGDRVFSCAFTVEDADYCFNFNEYKELPEKFILPREYILLLQPLFDMGCIIIHNAKFDMHFFAVEGIEFNCSMVCTETFARLVNNERKSYSLADQGELIGEKKDATVINWIKKNKAYSKRERAGRSWNQPRYDLVPFKMSAQYNMQDTYVCYKLFKKQMEEIRKIASTQEGNTLLDVALSECEITTVVFHMERVGVLCDVEYCKKGLIEHEEKVQNLVEVFKDLTGKDFVDSGLLFTEVFKSTDYEKFKKSDKDNFEFNKKILKGFTHPAAQVILDIRTTQTIVNFMKQFLFAVDADGVVHTNYRQAGTRTGRFSSKEPNLQNLKKDKDFGDDDFVVRRALIPRDGFMFVMIDYDQMEYRMMLDYAGSKNLIDKVLGGLDVHTATGQVAGINRDDAKTVNFGTLYGQGIKSLAASLNMTEAQASAIQNSIFRAAPEVLNLIQGVINKAINSRQIRNWLGRVYQFPKKWMGYKSPNTLIQGGAGDVVKVAMRRVHEYLKPYESRLVLNVHDELIFEIREGEEHLVPELKKIMEEAYPHKRLPLTCGIEYSTKSLADKRPWKDLQFKSVKETRNRIQREDLTRA